MQSKYRYLFLLALADIFLLLAILYRYEWQVTPKIADESEILISASEMEAADSLGKPIKPTPPDVQKLKLLNTQKLVTGRGVKSVFFDESGKYLYSVNLESGSVYEFDRASKHRRRYWKFDQTPAKGYDYSKRKWVEGSFAEKPVEGCLTHKGKYLWASWHNAGGVAAWRVDGDTAGLHQAEHRADLVEGEDQTRVAVHFFKTGETPKVLLPSPDGQWLFAANWHSKTGSCIDMSGDNPRSWQVRKSIKVGAVPRGMCLVGERELWVAGMASGSITRIDLRTLGILGDKDVGPTPRHLLNHQGRVYASLSSSEELLELNAKDASIRQKARTADDPRTIAISPDGRLLFVVCYAANRLQVFRTSDFALLGSWKCQGGPVGVDVYQSGDTVEVWVGNYKYATLKVFRIALIREGSTAS